MYRGKSVGPRMGAWRTPELTGYSCEDFPSRTTRSRLLLRKEELRPNIWLEIPWDLSLWRRPAYQTLSKALDISSATARVALALRNSWYLFHKEMDWNGFFLLRDLKQLLLVFFRFLSIYCATSRLY